MGVELTMNDYTVVTGCLTHKRMDVNTRLIGPSPTRFRLHDAELQ